MEKKPLKIPPFGKHLGIEILEVGEGVAQLKMLYRNELTNPVGNLHGGAIATVADSAMAVAIGSVLGTPARHFTVKLEIRYKAAVTDGMIIAEAKVTRRKKRLFLGEAIVKNGDGQVIATAAGTFMVKDSDAEPR
jgi:acyl-CoA thioesterase